MLWSVHSLRVYTTPGLNLDLLLFLCIYMNNSPTVVRHDEYYTDDTGLYLGGHDLLYVQHGFQWDLDFIQAWVCVSRLQFNVCRQSVDWH